MKKIYSLLILGCSSIIGFGQGKQNVTFSVDMNNYSASTYKGVYVNGLFNGWCGACNALTDADKDGVWEGTFEITADSMEYKFTLDGWTGQENLAQGLSCTKTTSGFTNRFMYYNGTDTVLPTVCFESCGKCEKVTNKMVILQVNMKNYTKSFNKLFVTGTFDGWSGNSNEMTDVDGDKIYTDTLTLTSDSIEYKFVVDAWADDEKLSEGSECTKTTSGFTNRFLKLTGNRTMPAVCWGICTECFYNVGFAVNMADYSTAFTGVFINGDFNGWCGSCNPMTDDDKDGIWTVSLPMTKDSFEFKYTIDGWNAQEALTEGSTCTKTTSGFTNRFVKLTKDLNMDTVCWNACENCEPKADNVKVIKSSDITIYPNPAHGELNVRVNGRGEMGVYQISDIQGRVIKTGVIDANIKNISVKNIPAGMYFMGINTSTGVVYKQFQLN